jgi:hypothetical protein
MEAITKLTYVFVKQFCSFSAIDSSAITSQCAQQAGIKISFASLM